MTGSGRDFDREALAEFLSAELDASVRDLEVLNDGLNFVVAVSTTDVDRAYVLRKPNKLRHTPLFTELDGEYAVLERLVESDVPAPEPVFLCEDESILGEAFFVANYLEGETVPLGEDLPARFRNERARRDVAEHLVDTLADVHTVDPAGFTDACDQQGPLDQVEIAVDRLDAAAGATGREYETLRSVGNWLRENAPAETDTALVHGDFRPGNVLLAGRVRPEITGVLDWETAMLGDPLTELGYLLLRWRDEGDPTPSLDDIEARHGDAAAEALRATNERGLAPFTAEAGSPTRRALAARYETATGRTFERPQFYLAHAAFMLGTVWADLDRYRVEAGGDPVMAANVDYAGLLAELVASGEFRL